MSGRIRAGCRRTRIVAAVAAVLIPSTFGSVARAGFDVSADVTVTKDDGVAVVDQDEIEIVALEDAEIVLVETDRLN